MTTGEGFRRTLAVRFAWSLIFSRILVGALAVASVILMQPSSLQCGWAAAPPQLKGTLWVFAVGVSQYKNSMIDLQFADNDAESLAATFSQRAAGIFKQVNTKIIINDQVTRRSIVDGLASFFSQAQPQDTGIIALMGHGVAANGSFYYVPYPADLDNLTTEALPLAEFESAVQKVSAKLARTVLIVDTCHAAALNFQVRDLADMVSRDRKARGISLVGEIAPKMPEAYILSSSEGSENSWEDANYRLPGEKKGHGAFTYALIRGLNGDAAHNGVVNILDLFTYASDEVPRITGDKQHPYVHGQGTNFEIAETRTIPSADQQQSAALTRQAVKARQSGNLKDAQVALVRAGELDPRNQVSRVLHDEITADITYRDNPAVQQDVIEETAALLKNAKNTGPEGKWEPRPMVLAFFDFGTMGNSPDLAGLHEALVARVTQSLQGTKRVFVVNRHLLDNVMGELKLSMSDLSDPDTRLKLGRILVARLIATGNVVFLGKDKYVVNLQMIDTETTEVKINISEQGTGADQILQVADKVEAGIVSQLQQNYPLRGKVAALNGNQLILDIGSKDGITVGTRMNAVEEQPIRINGEVVANRLAAIGTMEITEVHEKVSFAKETGNKVALAVGTKVIETSRTASGTSTTSHSPSAAGA